ncbi:MAG: beta-N-acetylhexosaminidase [Clostridiaceae bacterium]|nr:beta-N-acetylhexosaminidase [Clostridiaceae bacterium]
MIKKIVSYTIFMIMLFFLTGCSGESEIKNPDYGKVPKQNIDIKENISPPQKDIQEPEKEEDPIEKQIKNMTLEEKIGQMVVVGLDGYTIDEHALAMIENYYVGGFILFDRNVENAYQLLTLINSLKTINSRNKVPIFVSVDEEGGRVSRMPDELIKIPANKEIGEINNGDFSYQIGNIIAETIKSFGFNMNFAPVLDINSNPQNPVIGDRSFGADAEIVTELGIQTMKGLQKGGVISVVKHFPGHGDTLVDSHVGLPSVDHDLDRLKSFELIPFKEAIDNQADAVMIAHILMNKIDPQYPASLSKTVITELLRKELGFKGVVITDDMTMGAIVENYSIGDAAVRAINAGSDIVLVSHGYNNAVSAIYSIKNAVENGVIKKERIDESVYRILKLKQKYNLTDNITESIDIEKVNSKKKEVLEAQGQMN